MPILAQNMDSSNIWEKHQNIAQRFSELCAGVDPTDDSEYVHKVMPSNAHIKYSCNLKILIIRRVLVACDIQ